MFGVVCGVSAALGVASTYEGGLNKFLQNTVQNHSVLAGAGTSIGIYLLNIRKALYNNCLCHYTLFLRVSC